MIIHVLVDPNRPVTNETLDREIRGQGNGYAWFKADCIADANSAVRSINISHKNIVLMAKYSHYEEVMIIEEDIMFTDHGSLDFFIANKPVIYDLYLGGAYALNQAARERLEKEGPGAHEIHNFVGLHCYMIHSRYYDKFLSLPEDQHIDNQPGMGLFFVCYPFVALQHPGWSSNNRKPVDYNRTITPEMLYHGNTI